MNNFFTPNTGDEKLDEVYKKMQVHMMSFDKFSQFEKYFMDVAQTEDMKRLTKWILKVLFVQMKYNKHPFDELRELVNDQNAAKLKDWLDKELKKARQQK
jgi:hypothetical protein